MLIYLLLGCNVGNCLETFKQAEVELKNRIGNLTRKSNLYLTDAWGNTAQASFLNQVLEFETKLQPKDCLKAILKIEKNLGRVRNFKWEPRTIDIDILLYENIILNEDDLKIPHPYLHERKFAMIPLAEIDAEIIHPIYQKSISNLLSENTDNSLNIKRLSSAI